MQRFFIPTFALILAVAAFFVGHSIVDGDPVVMRLGDRTETLSEFTDRFEIAMQSVAAQSGAPLTDATRQQLLALAPSYLEQRAQEFALVAAAEERGVTIDDATLDARIDEIRGTADDEEGFQELLMMSGVQTEEMLRTLLYEDEIIGALFRELEAEQVVSDEQVQVAYDERQEQFSTGEQVCARHILLDNLEDAEAALAEIDAGADFAQVAVERSTGPSGPNGGDLGCFGRGMMVAPFEQAAFDAEVGVPVGPVETQFGQHLILVSERREATVAPLEEVEAALRGQLAAEATNAAVEAIFETANVETFPEELDVLLPPATME